MRTAWILALAGSLVACGPASAPPPDAPPVEVEDPAVPAAVDTAPLPSPYEVVETQPEEKDFTALAGYPEGWHVSYGWPGEYPAGFVVLDPGVSVDGRARPNKGEPATVSCALPQFANYQIWNRARVEGDELDFIVATKVQTITLSVDANIEYPTDNGMQMLELKAGDTLSYLRYLGEGFAIFGFDGGEYDFNEAELRDISDLASATITEDQWVDVPCKEGHRAWLLYDEVIAEDSIVPSPIVGYGDAYDIDPDEVEQVRSEGLEREAFENAPLDEMTGD
ncbi:MAG: hypothetical protein KDA53_17065 [Hyphomonas sp.]|nr:hypothetical protein [Hyphomonas sp.]